MIRTTNSDCRQRPISSSGNVGHARARKVVSRYAYVVDPSSFHLRDAWEKHKDLDPYEAKWMYIDTLLKVRIPPPTSGIPNLISVQVLRRYSDKTIAMNLVHELESYGGDPSNLVMSRTFQTVFRSLIPNAY